jgi:DNA-binding Lrp family transcriptional regulator
MAVSAYILIQTEIGAALGVTASIREIGGVDEANDVTGPYDVIAKATAKSVDELGRLVVGQIQSIGGITRTVTCPIVHL